MIKKNSYKISQLALIIQKTCPKRLSYRYSEKKSPLHDFQMIFEKKIDHSERWRNSGHQSTLSYLLFLPFTSQMEIEWLNFVSTVYRLGH